MDDGHEPATKADLEALERRLEDKFMEIVRDSETRLLKAIYDFAESNQKRLGATETLGALVVDRLGSIERRVTDIEKRLNTPPASWSHHGRATGRSGCPSAYTPIQ